MQKAKPQGMTEVQRLRARANKAAAESKANITLTLRIKLGLYKALVEEAERRHIRVSEVATFVMESILLGEPGKRAQRMSAIVDTTPLRAYPEAFNSERLADRIARQAAEERPVIKYEDLEIEEPTVLQKATLARMANIPAGALMPQSPPLPKRQEEIPVATTDEPETSDI